jgi:hypothetical protein
MVVASCCLFLTSHREVADTLHITDDTSQIINIFAMTLRTFLEVVLADMSTLVADGVRDVEREVVASFLGSDLKQLGVLSFGEMFLKIKVKS